MKLVLFAGLLLGFVAISFGDSCAIPNYTGFCKSSVSENHTTDSIINNFLPTIEGALQQYFPGFEQTLQNVAKNAGFIFCQDCWTALEYMVCAAAEPSCGFISCFTNSSVQITACTQSCASSCKGGASANLNSGCWTCISNCYASAIFQECKQYMMSTQMCTDFINICACNPDASAVANACSLFDPTGYYIPLPSSLSCTGSQGWCNSHAHGSLQAQAGQVCPNPSVCFLVPQSVGQTDITNPVTVATVSSTAWYLTVPILLVGLALLC